jgi:ABC-type Fe3+-hydroxamate transport system substrate-binding protein
MPVFTDQLGRSVALSHIPRRIISLVPSQTELLYSLGLEESVVGITRFCTRPQAWFREKSRIGGTKAIDPVRVDALRPDLILANKEENERPQVEALAERYPVWVSDVKTLADALAMIRSIGEITGAAATANTLADDIDRSFTTLQTAASPAYAQTSRVIASRPRVAYLVWRNPWMAAGGDTFIDQMLTHAGFDNIFADHTRFANVGTSAGGPVPARTSPSFCRANPTPFVNAISARSKKASRRPGSSSSTAKCSAGTAAACYSPPPTSGS